MGPFHQARCGRAARSLLVGTLDHSEWHQTLSIIRGSTALLPIARHVASTLCVCSRSMAMLVKVLFVCPPLADLLLVADKPYFPCGTSMQDMVVAPGTGSAQDWWRYQDCVAACAGNGLPGSCTAQHVDLQFPEPVPGMSSLWSGWQWCGARSPVVAAGKTVPPTEATDREQVGDDPGTSCSAHNPMMATNIVDRVWVPDVEPGDYLLSWRWDCEQVRAH